MHVAMLTSYMGKGGRQDTPMCSAPDPQQAIDYAKRLLTEQEIDPWVEVFDSRLNRKILVRTVYRSGKGPVEEFGWLIAVRIPQASDVLDWSTEVNADSKASSIL